METRIFRITEDGGEEPSAKKADDTQIPRQGEPSSPQKGEKIACREEEEQSKEIPLRGTRKKAGS